MSRLAKLRRAVAQPQWQLAVILVIAAALRVCYATDLPLSGDEVGVGVLQAAGNAVGYRDRLPTEARPIAEFTAAIRDTSNGFGGVIESLRRAGMHPPFYYGLLHLVLKVFGNDALLLRLLSVVFSLISILLIYRLGALAANPTTGVAAAAVLALSPFAIAYAPQARPYPLAMMLALLCACQVYRLVLSEALHKRYGELAVIALLGALGLYTIYHFLFVVTFLVAFLAFALRRRPRELAAAAAACALTGLLFALWLPSLSMQMKSVSGGGLYFHGASQPQALLTALAGQFDGALLARLPAASRSAARLVVALLGGALLIFGCYRLGRQKTLPGAALLIGLAAAFLANFIADRILHANTMAVRQLMFFGLPMLLLIIAAGWQQLPGRYGCKAIAGGIALLLVGWSGLRAIAVKVSPYDGPGQALVCAEQINGFFSDDERALVTVNTTNRRFLFCLLHAIRRPVEVQIVMAADLRENRVAFPRDRYDAAIAVCFEIPAAPGDTYTNRDLDAITLAMYRVQLPALKRYAVGNHGDLVFYRHAAAASGP